MKYLITALLASFILAKRSGGGSVESSTYIEYDSGWSYEPEPAASTYVSYQPEPTASTYISYDSGWYYDPVKP